MLSSEIRALLSNLSDFFIGFFMICGKMLQVSLQLPRTLIYKYNNVDDIWTLQLIIVPTKSIPVWDEWVMDMAVTLPILSPISYFSSTKGDNKNNSDVMYFIGSERNSNKNH